MKSQESSLEVDILALQRKQVEENKFSETEKTDILNELDVKFSKKKRYPKLKSRARL